MLARPTGPTLAAGDEPSAGAPRTRGRLARWLGLALETHISLPLFALALLISVILRRVRVLFPCLVLKRRHFFPWLYPETRAPPHRSAFSAF